MKKFFSILLSLLFFSNTLYAQTGREVNVSGSDMPAQAAPLQITVPHSERTKGNFLDAALDFLFVRFFKNFKNVEISYDFFEVNAQRDLLFTNFKVKSTHPEVSGTVAVQKVSINFSDFMEALKSQKITTSKVGLEKISGDLKIIETKKRKTENNAEKTVRKAVFKAELATLNDVVLAFWNGSSGTDTVMGSVSGKNIDVNISDPYERYAASSVEATEIKVPAGKIENVTFVSATVNGKGCADRSACLKLLEQ